MFQAQQHFPAILAVFIFIHCGCEAIVLNSNLSCYQCERHGDEECGAADLRPCAPQYDRCVLSREKDAKNGLKTIRQCGIAPCTFEDEMVTKSLGMNCDKSRESYSCVYCCKGNGCNKNSSPKQKTTLFLIITVLTLLGVTWDFMPPYVTQNR